MLDNQRYGRDIKRFNETMSIIRTALEQFVVCGECGGEVLKSGILTGVCVPCSDTTEKPSDNYWKQRCQLAEKCLYASPCDPDITKEQIQAHREYNAFLNITHIEYTTPTKGGSNG